MEKSDWSKTKRVFHEALEKPESEREIFLGGQSEIVRKEVYRLLSSHAALDGFIAEPISTAIGIDVDSYVGKRIGDYLICGVLGAGGMGRVFLAAKDGIEKQFALKIIKRGMDTDAILKRFIRERVILARLEHRFIASIVDAGQTVDGLPYFVMEFVDGVPITKFCDEHRFDVDERLELFRKVCDAVSYSHQNLIIHRDLKPSNIFVCADGTPKLLDFGIAKLLEPEIADEFTTTGFHTRMLTPEYASPEHINGLPTSTTTDVYSLGVVLYELLSGARPFDLRNLSYLDAANAILSEEPVRPSLFSAEQLPRAAGTLKNAVGTADESGRVSHFAYRKLLKGDLDNIVLKAIRKEPERRYQSAHELAEDIRRYLDGLPVTATADSVGYRLSKFVRRNKISTAVAAAFVILSAISVWQTFVATAKQSEAEERFEQVRKLANAVIFDYQDEIAPLPGSIGVRKKMVRDGAEYLDHLLAAKSSDPDLKIELARAYDRLGDITANFSRTSVGNGIEAREYYATSLAIKEEMMAADPDNANLKEQLAASYDSLGDIEFGFGNQSPAVEYYRKAIALREVILTAEDRADVRFRLMKGYRNVAVRGRRGDNTSADLDLCRKALDMSEKFLQAEPDNVEYLEAYGDVIEGIAAILETDRARRPEAVDAYRNLIGTRRQHAERSPANLKLRQKYGMSFSYLGDTYFEMNDLPMAIESYRKSLEILDPLAASDSLNESLIQDTANIRSSYAFSLALTGNTAESFDAFNAILPVFRSKYERDNTDKIAHFRIAMATEGLAKTYVNISNLPGNSAQKSIESLENALFNFERSLEIYSVYQRRDSVFTTVAVDVDNAIAEVNTAMEKCHKRLDQLRRKR